MNKTAIFRDELFLEHDPGYGHVESSDRLAVIHRELDRSPLKEQFVYPAFAAADRDMLLLNHTPSHVDRIAHTAGKSFCRLDPDTATSPRSYEAATLAVGAVVEAVKLLAEGKIDNGFALVRPPGHHAERDMAMGFCLFNSVACGAAYAIRHLGMNRVMIVDWDLHHGNGTQHSFYDRKDVLYFSTHQYPYYPGSGALSEIGVGEGEGFTVNIPLPGGQDDRFYAAIFNDIMVPIARQYQPELILVSAGLDIYRGDPLGGMNVSIKGIAYLARTLVELARETCGGRIFFVLEGGYNLEGLKSGVLACLREMNGSGALDNESHTELSRCSLPEGFLGHVRDIAKEYWKL